MHEKIVAFWNDLGKDGEQSRYLAYGLAVVFGILFLMQLAAQFFTVGQLDRDTGKITKIRLVLTSYRLSKTKHANYSLFITLDDSKTYNVELDNSNFGVEKYVRAGGTGIVYNPTHIYNILSLDCLDWGIRASQFEYNNTIIYSFDHHQADQRPYILGTLAFFLLCCYYLSPWNRVKDAG